MPQPTPPTTAATGGAASAEPRRCVRCITTTAYPGLTFDADGVCSVCRSYDEKFRDYRPKVADFLAAIRKGRRRGSRYAALVGVSGGKDSCYVLHVLVKEHGIRDVLAVTYDNGFLPEGARRNVEAVVGGLGLEHRYYGPGPELNRRLHQAAIAKRFSDLCIFCMAGISSGLLEIAVRERIGTVVTGMAPRTEPMFPYEMSNWFDHRLLKDVATPEVGRRELGAFRYIRMPLGAWATFVKRVNFIHLPEYMDWDADAIRRKLEAEYGWVDYGKGTPHFDCVAAPAIDYFQWRRLGTNKEIEGLSTLVRAGKVSREEALRRLAAHERAEVPTASMEELARRTGVGMEALAPYAAGQALSYRRFRSNVPILRRFAWVLWITWKLGLTSRILYEKFTYTA